MVENTEDIKQEQAVPTPETTEASTTEKESTALLAALTAEDEEQTHEVKHFKDVLRALSIDGQWFRKQLGVIVLIVAGIILYITNRYQAQQEMIEESKLRNELHDWRFRSMTRNSELTLHSRQSQVEDKLKAMGDSTLLPSHTPPYLILDE